MRSSRKNRSNGDNVSHRRNVDQAKAARAKAAIKAAKSQSPKSVYKNRKFKAAVDLETPKSLLVNIRLKSVINLDTYSLLSRVEKERLVVLLPSCDQQKDRSGMPILNSEALNNEFFAKACVEWCERLGEGEFLKDRQQGETSSGKVRQFGTLNGAKSHVIESLSTDTKLNRGGTNRHSTISPRSPLLQHVTRLRNGSGRHISVKLLSDSRSASIPQRCRQRARNLRLEQLALDDDASLVSETSSESSLSVYGEQSRVGSSCLGYGGDSSSLATLGSNKIRSRVTRCETSLHRVSELFVHPALRDHDYADSMVESKSKTSRVSTGRGRYRRRRRKRKRVRSKKPDSVGVLRSGDIALEMQGREFHTPVDMLASSCGTSLTANALATVNDVLCLNGAKVDCKVDDIATNSQVLSFDNSVTSNPSVKSNGRLNGTCSPNKREHGHSAPAQHPVNITTHDSWLKENDVNLNYVTRPHRLKTVQHLRKCEQTDGMPLIQIQGSDLLSRVSCANSETVASVVRVPCNSPVLPSSLRFGKTEFNACDRDFNSPPASDPQNTRTTSDDVDCSNSASLHRFGPVRWNESGVSSDCRTKSDEKFFVKLIGVQKITRDCELTEGKPNSCSGEFDSSLDSIASVLPQSVVQEVQRYAHVRGNVPYVGQHSSSSPVQCNGKSSLGHSLEISFPSNDIRSHEDSVELTSSSRQTDVRENGLPRRNNMQNFKLIPDLRNHRPNCSRALDASECVWEAVRREADATDRGH